MNSVWGPNDFGCDVVSYGSPFNQPLDSYMFVVKFLLQQATQDFNGTLPRLLNAFQYDEYPRTFLGVRAKDTTSLIARRYVLWSMARIMNHMTVHGYMGGTYELSWQGQEVGSIVFIDDTLQQAQADFLGFNKPGQNLIQQIRESSDTTNMTTTAVGVGQITWEFKNKDDPLPRNDLFMGLIGSLIFAARSSTQNFEAFVGSFLNDYKAVYFFGSTRQPSIFSKAILVNTLVATAR